jgi:hypothetical protein
MKKRTWTGLAAIVVVLGAAVVFGYRKWGVWNGSAREEALALMPTDAIAILFADFDELRQAPFVAKLYAWAPKPQADADYAQFVKETGFDFERDLERIAIAVEKRGQDSTLFAILDGKFDRQKISAYALKDGSAVKTGGREIFFVPVSGTAKKVSLTFLRNDRIAVTGDANLVVLLDAKKRAEDAADWRGLAGICRDPARRRGRRRAGRSGPQRPSLSAALHLARPIAVDHPGRKTGERSAARGRRGRMHGGGHGAETGGPDEWRRHTGAVGTE